MKKFKTIGWLAAVALGSVTGTAAAAITSPVTIEFEGLLLSSFDGKGNVTPLALGACPDDCYHEDGAAFGVVNDPLDGQEHLHRNGGAADRAVGYHADSSGIYVRADDSTPFSLDSLDFSAPISDTNPGTGPLWEILGFNTALNDNLASGNGTDYVTRVAYQTVDNGFSGTFTLDAAFHNISAFWIHHVGYPAVPTDGVDFGMELDNVHLSAAVAAVPVPAAVWLFGSALLGLAASARKRGTPAAV